MKRKYAESVTDPTTGPIGPQIPEVKTTSLRRSRLRRRTSNGNDGQLARTMTNNDGQRQLRIILWNLWIFFMDYFTDYFMEETKKEPYL